MQINEQHFFKGADTTSDLRLVQPDHYVDAQDVEHFQDDVNTIGAIRPMKSSNLAFSLGSITPQNQVFRIQTGTNFGTDDYVFNVFNDAPFGNLILTITINNPSSINDLGDKIVAAFLSKLSISTSYFVQDSYVLSLEILNQTNYNITQTINGINENVYIVQQAYNFTAEIVPLQSVYINQDLVYFAKAKDQEYYEIGGAVRNQNGVWTVKKIASSNDWNFPTTEVIDARIEERTDDKYSLYWCDNTNKPRCIYFDIDFINMQYAAMKYYWNPLLISKLVTNPTGLYEFGVITKKIEQQLSNNTASIEYDSQLGYGGSLQAGSWRYAVQFGINGTDYTTPFSELSEEIIVFTASNATNNGGNIKGDKTPMATTKSNVLRIKNSNPSVFNFFNLACVLYQGGAVSATVIKKYILTENEFTITHTGNELNTQTLDVAALPNVTPVILKNKSIEIKKNRWNTANVELAVDANLQSIASAITIDTGRKSISSVGSISPVVGSRLFSVNSNDYQEISDGGTILLCPNGQNDFNLYNGSTYTATTTSAGGTNFVINISLSSKNDNPLLYTTNVDCAIYFRYIPNGGGFQDILLDTVRRGSVPEDNYYKEFVYTINQGDQVQLVIKSQTDGGVHLTAKTNSFTAIKLEGASLNYKDSVTIGEYGDATNVAKYTGYLNGETYAFFIKFKYKNGYISSPYYIGNHTFPFRELTDSQTTANRQVYVYHPVFSNINIVSIKDQLDGFSIVRAKCNPSILAAGIVIPANDILPDGMGIGEYASQPDSIKYGTKVPYDDAKRQYGAFISSDLMFGDEGLKYEDNQQLLLYSMPSVLTQSVSIPSSAKQYSYWSYTEYLGNDPYGYSVAPNTIVDSNWVVAAEGTVYSKYVRNGSNRYKAVLSTDGLHKTMSQDCQFITTENVIQYQDNLGNKPPIANDTGVYMACVRKYKAENDTTPQYDIKNVTIVETGHFQAVAANSPYIFNDVDVFGGDVYTQKVFVRICKDALHPQYVGNTISTFISYYAQNRINVQMRHSNEVGAVPLFPADCQTLAEYLTPDTPETFLIDDGYNQADNNINVMRAYDSTVPSNSRYISRIYYSQQKPTGSVYDGYRQINPLDFKDIDSKNGGIVCLADVNDTMLAIQPKAVTSLPYQTDVLLKSDSGAEIYIGNGGVYAQRETIVSTYGSSIKSATFLGFNRNGNRVLYWYSPYYQRLMRYSYDGIKTISEEGRMRNWFLTNTKFISNEYDIVMGFDTRRNNLWVSSRCSKDVQEYNNSTPYDNGAIVKVSNPNYAKTFYKSPDIYVNNSGSILTGHPPYNPNSGWSLIPHSDNQYYNEWTWLFNETENAFKTRCSVIPNRYFNYKDFILVPRSVYPFSQVYELLTGNDVLKFLYYGSANPYLQGEFQITPVINKQVGFTKSFLSVGLDTAENNVNNPNIDFNTTTGSAYVFPADYEQINSQIWAAVPDNNGDTLQGEWMKAKIRTENDITILGMIGRFYYRPRYPMK